MLLPSPKQDMRQSSTFNQYLGPCITYNTQPFPHQHQQPQQRKHTHNRPIQAMFLQQQSGLHNGYTDADGSPSDNAEEGNSDEPGELEEAHAKCEEEGAEDDDGKDEVGDAVHVGGGRSHGIGKSSPCCITYIPNQSTYS
jgi:hypothetical protein